MTGSLSPYRADEGPPGGHGRGRFSAPSRCRSTPRRPAVGPAPPPGRSAGPCVARRRRRWSGRADTRAVRATEGDGAVSKLVAIAVGALCLASAGCGGGEPRLDASDAASLDASVKAMTGKMTAAEREELARDAQAVAKPK